MRRRGLNGILAEHDAAEDGSRELAGEWVDAREEGAKDEERVILYLHGGKPISAFGTCGTGANRQNRRLLLVQPRHPPAHHGAIVKNDWRASVL